MAELSSAAGTGPSSVGPVGVVGLGAMGSRMAHRLLDAGRFRLSLARKDADLTLAAAASAGQDLRLVLAARSWLAEAERRGAGEKDYTAMLATILGAGRQGEHRAGGGSRR